MQTYKTTYRIQNLKNCKALLRMHQAWAILDHKEECLKNSSHNKRIRKQSNSRNPMKIFNGCIQKLLIMIDIIELRIKLHF